jgi:hypothetical protein
MLQKNMTIISSLVSLGTLVIVRNCSGYEAFMHLLLQEPDPALAAGILKRLLPQLVLELQL